MATIEHEQRRYDGLVDGFIQNGVAQNGEVEKAVLAHLREVSKQGIVTLDTTITNIWQVAQSRITDIRETVFEERGAVPLAYNDTFHGRVVPNKIINLNAIAAKRAEHYYKVIGAILDYRQSQEYLGLLNR